MTDPMIEKIKAALQGRQGVAILPTFKRFPDKTQLEKEQPGLELSKSCDFCESDVWVSLKKRNIRQELPDTLFVCYECFVVAAKKHKGIPSEVHKI